MNYKAHQFGGLTLGASAAILKYGFPKTPETLLLSLVVTGTATAAALLPDIDEPSSKFGREALGLSAVVKTVAGHRGAFHSPFVVGILWGVLQLLGTVPEKWQSITAAGIVSVVVLWVLLTGRRKHPVWLLGLVAGAVWLVMNRMSPEEIFRGVEGGVLIGYTSHLLMDMTNRAGIPLFYPLSRKKFHIMTLKTNRDEVVAEGLFAVPLIITVLMQANVLKNPFV